MLTAQAARFPEIEPVELDTARLAPVEQTLAHALYDGAVRRWLTLEYLVQQPLRQPFRGLEPALQAVLLVGAAQLALFDRIPAHAAIDEAVGWAKQRIRPGAGSLVNAVLRRVAEELGPAEHADTDDPIQPGVLPLPHGRQRPMRSTRWPDDPLERLARTTSTPPSVLRRWKPSMTYDQAEAACLHGLTKPPTILNVTHSSGPLPPETVEPHTEHGFARWTGDHAPLADMLRARSDVWAQDPASAAAIRSIADLRPARVLDICAGQGTKTRQLAATFPEATIVATDVDARRFAALRETCEALPNTTAVPHNAIEKGGQLADLILLDVPCSNTGVFARRVEARYRATAASVERLVGIQRRLIADSLPMLAPGGGILYATCSVEPVENGDIARWACDRLGMAASRSRQTLPTADGGPGASIDGSFSVLLRAGPSA